MRIEIAFDIGGTFTDFAISVDGVLQPNFVKVPTSNSQPAIAALQGLKKICERFGVQAEEVASILHATTIATNAILERRGANTALITTRGFRDVLLIGRQKRHDTFSLRGGRPEPLLKRHQIYELSERTAADGSCLQSPDEREVRELARRIEDSGYRSVAVCFLHSYANGENERQVAEWVSAEAPLLDISISSDVSPRIREYERTNTVVANAYVRSSVKNYIDHLLAKLQESDFHAGLHIMQSNGGLAPATICKDYPVRLLESGPAAGVLMCAAVCKTEQIKQVLTFDMGGTTAKLGAIDNGQAAVTPSFEVDLTDYRRGSGLPLNIPSVELIEIGAGGGSIAWIEAGVIRVGPRSASSTPGPACYGRGGVEPTLTDANVVLGYINTEEFNAKAFSLDVAAAYESIRSRIAEPLSLTVEHAAWAIHLLATNKMGRALRSVSIERGRDPRGYAMVAFGGAGPLHAARLAHQARMKKLVIPYGAGVGSAIGLLAAPQRLDVSVTRILFLEESGGADVEKRICALFEDLEGSLSRQISTMGYEQDDFHLARHVSGRLAGQGFEIKVSLHQQDLEGPLAAGIRHAFLLAYGRIYGAVDPSTAVEIVDWGVTGVRHRESRLSFRALASRSPTKKSRSAYFPEAGGYVSCSVYQRESLPAGYRLEGPALIDEDETTTVLLPQDICEVTSSGNLLVSIGVSDDEDPDQ